MEPNNTDAPELSEERERIATQLELAVYYLSDLDIEMLSTTLDQNKIYNGFGKIDFLNRLNRVFERFVEFGDIYLNVGETGKNFCGIHDSRFYFIGDKSGNAFKASIKVDLNDDIIDMYDCCLKVYFTSEGSKKEIVIKIEDDSFSGVNAEPLKNTHPKFIFHNDSNCIDEDNIENMEDNSEDNLPF